MRFTLTTFAALFSIIVATPTPGAGGVLGPPARKVSHVKQQCQAHQANIRCCNLAGGNNGGNNKYDVQVGDQSMAGICDQDITHADGTNRRRLSALLLSLAASVTAALLLPTKV
ncbi:hypothetical protein LTR56_026834 [Elasticomyces elasticus]|nr:hypothetical protein LTR22_027951 [Elasticomyces elasticus]KAK3615056.1 hypothetical protein LTR56_026834 [Elasticomyces elasticus]KAK4895841.1 hypothetical protein LTR49_028218 [Elasticomyces elasticus]